MKNIQPVDASVVYRFVPTPQEPTNRTTTTPEDRFPSEAYPLDLSDRAAMLAELADAHDLRIERIARLRDEIADGIYETPDKIRVAAERLIDELL
ncbi:MAG: flagellar biosynthesis anti-sigma factor FlgM [Planctomycetes bacterium]|nr:flagellar biosynthesis anti-sigma factor FlgM [Planctomycetota bacterium]